MITPHDPDLVPHDGFHNCPPIPHDHLMVSPPIGIGPRGPEGPAGPQGPKGDTGEFNTPTASVDSSVGTPYIEVTSTGEGEEKVFNFAFHNMKGDTFTFDDLTDEQLGELRDEIISIYYRKDEQSVNITSGFPITTIEIPFADFQSTDMLLVDINGLDLAETTEYYIDDGDIILGTPLTHSAKVNFKRMTAIGLTPRDFSDLAGGDIADAIEAWLDDHPEATTTVQDGSITEAKLASNLKDAFSYGVKAFNADKNVNLSKSGYISIGGSGGTIDPNNYTIQSGNVSHEILEVELGDIFEIKLCGGSGARCWALVAGSTYSTPYAILHRMPGEMADNITKTFIVIHDPNVKYLVLQNKNASNPNYYVRKVSKAEYLDLRSSIDFAWLADHFAFRGWALHTDGVLYQHNTNVVSPFIPVRYGDYIEAQLSASNNVGLINYYDDNFNFVFSTASGTNVDEPVKFNFTAPEHGYIRVCWYYNPAYIDESADWAHELFSHFMFSIKTRADNVTQDLLAESSDELELLRASRMYTETDHPAITLLHFSDIHGDSPVFRTIAECLGQKQLFGKYIDGAICTGDIVFTHINNSTEFLTKYCNYYYPIMLSIGNHDQRPESQARWHYTTVTQISDTYDRFIAPFMDEWNIVTNSEINYPTYYYRDFNEQGERIRLIVLDPQMGSDVSYDRDMQISWFEEVLADAKASNFGVVVAQHFPIQGTARLIDCNFTDLVSIPYTQIGDSNYNQSTIESFQRLVQSFINSGGDFICWLSGHNHADFVYTVSQYPQQLCIIIGCATTRKDSRMADRMVGKAQVLFNTVTISRDENHIRLVRFGANFSRYMVSKKSLCINYKTMQILSQS